MSALISVIVLPSLFLLGARASPAVNITQTCHELTQVISSASSVYWPGSAQYADDVKNYFDSSSAQAVCSVEPGTTTDVGKILRVLGSTQTPFGVKGGGHAYNPTFSSSSGVEISMARFNSIVYDQSSQTVNTGVGLVWDDVYAALEPFNVTTLGGRLSGIGVAGLALGGGYSYLTNEHGLTLDTIVSLELVLPSGEVTTIGENVNQELFSAVKGGYNNFGIVTQLTLRTFAQGPVWGGVLLISSNFSSQVRNATARFIEEVDDPKAAILSVDNFVNGELIYSVILFYNEPEPPNGMFDDFTIIPSILADVSTRSYLSLIQAIPSARTAARGLSNTVPLLDIPPALIDAVLNETLFWGNALLSHNVSLSFGMEPFLSDILSHASVDSAAYPPSRKTRYLPLALAWAWPSADADAVVHAAAAQSVAHLTQVALSLGQDIEDAAPYGNYALADTTSAEILWRDKLPALSAIKAKYDPTNVMGLTGGWKI